MADLISSNAEERLQQYQEQLLEIVNKCPDVIEHLDWCDLTNGFDANEINFFIMGISEREVMEKLIQQLNADWEKSLKKLDPRIFVDQYNCDIIKYGGEENPVRFSTFLEETQRAWINREIDYLMI